MEPATVCTGEPQQRCFVEEMKVPTFASEIDYKSWASRNMRRANSLDEGRLMMIDWRMVWLKPQTNCV
jgi:hypothetical protein